MVVVGDSSMQPESNESKNKLRYGVDSVPPWNVTVFLCFQQFTAMFMSIVTVPFVIGPALCVPSDHPARAYILSTLVFVSGMVSFLQATFGIRLPIMQGPSASFYAPIFAIMSLPQWHCPFDVTSPGIPANFTDEVWQTKMREIQGAISVSSLLPIILSLTGALTILKRYITPLVVTPTIAVIGLSLFKSSCELSSGNWAIAICTIILLLAFSQYLPNVMVPFPGFSREKRCYVFRFQWFCFFPIITTVMIIWFVCYVLTICDVLPAGNGGRTDIKHNIVTQSIWFRFPYPFQWGIPTVSLASVLGMTAAILASMVESMGDYFACANMCSVSTPPASAINRGILFEGLACTLAGLWGAGVGTTSYADTIGTIGITKVGSVRVVQITSICMMLAAIFTKFTAVLATIPDPLIGGMYIFIFGMVLAVALSNVQFIDLRSTRNIFVLGFSIFFGFSLANYVETHPGIIKTGNEVADQVITVVLSTSMLLAGLLGFVLDNTIPGTAEERGLHFWNPPSSTDDDAQLTKSIYDFPFGMSCIRKLKLFHFIPVCPTYVPKTCCTCTRKSGAEKSDESDVTTLTRINQSSDNCSFEME